MEIAVKKVRKNINNLEFMNLFCWNAWRSFHFERKKKKKNLNLHENYYSKVFFFIIILYFFFSQQIRFTIESFIMNSERNHKKKKKLKRKSSSTMFFHWIKEFFLSSIFCEYSKWLNNNREIFSFGKNKLNKVITVNGNRCDCN